MTTTLPPLSAVSRPALRHDVVNGLLRSIFLGEMPAGTRLVIQKLAQQLNVSSTPVREALLKLEAVGLVKFYHNRGAVVKRFGAAELREIYHLRRVLEAEATACACGKIDEATLRRLQQEFLILAGDDSGANWSHRAMAADRELHDTIARQCGNARLADEIERYNMLVQIGRDLVGNQLQAQKNAVQEHLEIVDALLRNDAKDAAGWMAKHIDHTCDIVATVMFPPA
ncbi:MAG: GntR family transcriptional regulator [Pirellulales bacterium]